MLVRLYQIVILFMGFVASLFLLLKSVNAIEYLFGKTTNPSDGEDFVQLVIFLLCLVFVLLISTVLDLIKRSLPFRR